MRILIVLNSFEADGPGRLAVSLCERIAPEEWARLGVVAVSRGGPLSGEFRRLGVSTEVAPTRGRGGLRRLYRWAGELAGRADAPDLIHTNLLWPDLALRLVWRRLQGRPLVSTCHGLHALGDKGRLLGGAYRVAERTTRSRCNHWVAVSEFVRRAMEEDGYPPDRITLVRNGVDAVQYHPLGAKQRAEMRQLMNAPHDALLIGAAGALRQLKGHDVLLRAMPEIVRREPRAMLYLFGTGPAEQDLRDLVARLGLGGHVRLVGELSALLPRVLASMDVVAHPSRAESFGLVVGEAQACGVPVVASRVGGIPEILRDGETGLLVPPEDPAALAQALGKMLGDEDARTAMGCAARQFVVGEREIGDTAWQYVQLWRRLLDGTGRETSDGVDEPGGPGETAPPPG